MHLVELDIAIPKYPLVDPSATELMTAPFQRPPNVREN
jgi:hypothetical protein